MRIVDDFLAKNANVGRCADFREVADTLSKVRFASEMASKAYVLVC